jgi:hypothetical protein
MRYLHVWEQRHGSDHRTPEIQDILAKHDGDVQRALPDLRSDPGLICSIDEICRRTAAFARAQNVEAAMRLALAE